MKQYARQFPGLVAVLVSVGFAYWVFAYIIYDLGISLGTDYLTTFRLATQFVLDGNGTEMYTAGSWGYYNAPWLMLVFLPLELLSRGDAVVVWNGTSLILLIISVYLWRIHHPAPTIAVILALINPHTLDLFVRSQVEGLIVVAAVGGWLAVQQHRPIILGIAIAVIIVKPLNILLVLLTLLFAIKAWSWQEKLMVMTPTAFLGFASMPIFGIDYPLRYVRFGSEQRPTDTITITLWKAAEQIGIPSLIFIAIAAFLLMLFLYFMWKHTHSVYSFALAITTMLVITTYANSNHYIMLIPVILLVAAFDLRLAVIAYIFTWTPLLRIWYGDDASWIDILYPSMLLGSLWYIIYRTKDFSITNAQEQ